MKKLILLLVGLAMCFGFRAYATVHSVTVQDFEFTPAIMTVNVGDTISWIWMNGSHTTTSNIVPEGASSWNSAINSTTTSFSYVVMTEGEYDYNCTIHPTLMIGSFTAAATTGIPVVGSNPFLTVSNTLLSNELQVNYSLSSPASVSVGLFNITGVRVKNFTSTFHTPGEYSETFAVGSLPKGMYFLTLRTQNAIVTRKVVME